GGFHEGRRRREDDVDIHADQFGREFRQLLDAFRPAELNDNVLALDVAVIAQSRPQRLDPTCRSRSGGETQEPDARDLRRLLRTRRERPRRRRAAEQRDERAPVTHSTPSSARASSLSGTCRRSAFAMPRLMTSSNLVGCTTGRSAGFSPLRIRPAYTPIWR